MVDPQEFEAIRAEICASGPASGGDNLVGFEIDACAFLGDPAYAEDEPRLWQDMTVRSARDGEWLILGEANGREGHASAIADALSRIWADRLRYRFRSAHTVVCTPGAVSLRAVTQIAPGGFGHCRGESELGVNDPHGRMSTPPGVHNPPFEWPFVLFMVEKRLGVWVGRPTYERAVALVTGFDMARPESVNGPMQARHRSRRVRHRRGVSVIGWAARDRGTATRASARPQHPTE